MIHQITKIMNVEKVFQNFCNLKRDIEEHLPTLRKYSSLCENVVELGTRTGISTLAFLIGKPKKVTSIDLNSKYFKPYENKINEFANACNVPFVFIEADDLKIDIESCDLLFIDTLHTYEQLSKELDKHHNKVKKWIILHDTVTFGYKDETFYSDCNVSDQLTKNTNNTGLWPAINEFLNLHKEWNIKEIYENNNGLTVLEKLC